MKQNGISKNIVWLAWERHRRTIELCRYFGIKPVIFVSALSRVLKHPFFVVKTIGYLLWKRPKVLIVQNPSIVLTLLGCLLHRVLGFYYIVDAHNGGIVADSPIGKKFSLLYRVWQKEADLTIVTNRFMAEIVEGNGGQSFILPDKLPQFKDDCSQFGVEGRINILCISTFDTDEPFQEVFAAAKELPEDYLIYITGDYGKIDLLLQKKCPKQIRLTGFLSEDDYWALLSSVDVVMDLTSRESCLVCGAYEAVSQKKPLILSDTIILKEYFNKGVIFTENDSERIQEAIVTTVDTLAILKDDIVELGVALDEQWVKAGGGLARILHDNSSGEVAH